MTNIEIILKEGVNPGKTIVILAGVHGNETCGVNAFNTLIKKLKIESGKVYFIYANLKAIKQNKRFIEYNLNRAFIKNPVKKITESLEGKTAKEIMPYLEEADAMLDIHASFTPKSIPFVICDKRWLNKAKMFDAEIISFNWDRFEPGSTDYYMNLQGKPGFCFECGFLGDYKAKNRAEEAIIRFLVYYKCISGKLYAKDPQRIIKIIGLYKNRNSRFVKSRFFKDFEELKKKTLIGKEGKKEVYAEKGQIVLFVRDNEELNQECFLIAKEIKNQKINKTPIFSEMESKR